MLISPKAIGPGLTSVAANLASDLGAARRMLLRAPGYALASILTLALTRPH